MLYIMIMLRQLADGSPERKERQTSVRTSQKTTTKKFMFCAFFEIYLCVNWTQLLMVSGTAAGLTWWTVQSFESYFVHTILLAIVERYESHFVAGSAFFKTSIIHLNDGSAFFKAGIIPMQWECILNIKLICCRFDGCAFFKSSKQ